LSGSVDGHKCDSKDASVLFFVSFTLTQPKMENIIEVSSMSEEYSAYMMKKVPYIGREKRIDFYVRTDIGVLVLVHELYEGSWSARMVLQ
jgi:hypothetical protein